MKSGRALAQAALVIRWPQTVPAAGAREVARRLAASRTPATWAIDQASQAESLASWGAARGGVEIAMNVPAGGDSPIDANAEGAAIELTRRLDVMRSSAVQVDVIHAGPCLAAGSWPRTLRALGIHAVVIDDSQSAAGPRAMPFGVWQFTPQSVTPSQRRWLGWLAPRTASLDQRREGVTVAAIDLGRLGTPGSRAWREMEAAVDQAAKRRAAGAIELATVGEITSRLAQANAPRPQRSILRAAA